MKHAASILITVIIVGAPALALAQRDRRPPPPPKEAFEACDGLEEGGACSFDLPHARVDGTCRAPRGSDELHCIPNRPPPPPPEAVDACVHLSAGDECAFESPHGTVDGTCRDIRDVVVCAPNHPPLRRGSTDERQPATPQPE